MVGESPGMTEMRMGVPFIGKSGHLLRSLLRGTGYDTPTTSDLQKALRQGDRTIVDSGNVYYTNAALCVPTAADADTYKTSSTKKEACVLCRDRLVAELEPYLQRDIPVCALGGGASLALVGNEEITKIRGLWHSDDRVLTTWHPAYVLRQPTRVSELTWDLQKPLAGGPAYRDFPEVDVTILETDQHMLLFTEMLLAMVERGDILDNTVSFDIESANINYRTDPIICLQFSWDVDIGAVVSEDIIHSPITRECLLRLFAPWSGIKFMGHNAKFDVKFLYYQLGVWNARFEYDSLLGDYILDENRMHGLKELLADRYSLPDYEQDLVQIYLRSKNDDYRKVPRPQLYKYGALDTAYTLRLWRDVRAELEERGLWEQPFLYPMMALQPMWAEMELYGMQVDRDRITDLSRQLRDFTSQVQAQLVDLGEASADFNPNSWIQVGKVMYDYFHMPLQKIRKLNPRSTAKPVRQAIERHYREHDQFDCPAMEWLLLLGQWRSLEKLRSSYVDNLIPSIDQKQRVHPDILAYGTETGRISVRNPALQTIPRKGTGKALGKEWGREIKLCFNVPDECKMIQVDYGQAELRTAAWMAQDPFLLECYREGKDIHGEVSEAFFPGYYAMKPEDRMATAIGPKSKSDIRKEIKKCVFGRMYLGTAYTIAETLNCTMGQAKEYLAILDSKLGGLVKFENAQWELMRTQGYVETLTGRRRRVPLIVRENQDDARKAACNAPVQGMASDLTIMATYEAWKWLHADSKFKDVHILITVHDSIILEVPDGLVEVVALKTQEIMERIGDEWMPGIPWVADMEVGNSWGELEAWSSKN